MENKHPPLICLGLTGRMGSGKGELVKIFTKAGFTYVSLSDIVRQEVKKLGKPVNRAEMQNIGNRLRQEQGPGVLAQRIREKISKANISKWIIDGIRNPAEIKELRKLPSFFLIAVEAEIDIIMNRLKKRARNTDLADDQELIRRLQREWGEGEPEDGQQVGKCMAMADFTIKNNSNLQALNHKVDTLLKNINYLPEN